MTLYPIDPYSRFLLAVHDRDLDVPLPRAGRSMARALRDGLVRTEPPLRADGAERKRPVAITSKGVGYLRELGLISIGE